MATARASRSIVQRARSPEREREIKRALGSVPELFRHVMPVPWVMRVGYSLGSYPSPNLSAERAAMVGFVVSRDHACRYCAGLGRTLLRINGFDDALIDRLERDIHGADLDPAVGPALELARKISRLNPAPGPRDFEKLRKRGYSEAAIVDLVFVAAFSAHSTRVATFLDIPPESIVEFAQKPLFRVVRPLLRRSLSSRRGRWSPRALPRDAAGRYDELLANYRLPAPLRDTIRWSLAHLDTTRHIAPHTTAVIIAVIARALGCPDTERAALAAAESHGLPRARAETWLRRLYGPEMSPLERELIPLARETGRYQTHIIKPRFAAFSEEHSDETVIEFVALCGLANMLCRLEALAHA